MLNRRVILTSMAAMPLATSLLASTSLLANISATIERRIPGSPNPVPAIGIGTARSYSNPGSDEDYARLRDTLSHFVKRGGQMIDTAPSYGRAEEVIGRLTAELGIRDKLYLATKVGADSKEDGAAQLKQSFVNFGTEKIDLIAVHNLRDITNQLASLRDLKTQGRVSSIGATTSFDRQYEDFEAMMRRETLDVIQIDYALDNRDAGNRILPLAQEKNVAVMINLPFGRGRLFEATKGKPLPGWAAEIDAKSWAQIFLKYVISHPSNPIAIPGTSQVRHIEDNMGAAQGRLPDANLRKRMENFIDAL